jgi:hypothetical protein
MLGDMDKSILDFERAWTGPKDRIIEFTLGLSSENYYSRLRELVIDTEARTYDPLTVRRVAKIIGPGAGVEAVG